MNEINRKRNIISSRKITKMSDCSLIKEIKRDNSNSSFNNISFINNNLLLRAESSKEMNKIKIEENFVNENQISNGILKILDNQEKLKNNNQYYLKKICEYERKKNDKINLNIPKIDYTSNLNFCKKIKEINNLKDTDFVQNKFLKRTKYSCRLENKSNSKTRNNNNHENFNNLNKSCLENININKSTLNSNINNYHNIIKFQEKSELRNESKCKFSTIFDKNRFLKKTYANKDKMDNFQISKVLYKNEMNQFYSSKDLINKSKNIKCPLKNIEILNNNNYDVKVENHILNNENFNQITNNLNASMIFIEHNNFKENSINYKNNQRPESKYLIEDGELSRNINENTIKKLNYSLKNSPIFKHNNETEIKQKVIHRDSIKTSFDIDYKNEKCFVSGKEDIITNLMENRILTDDDKINSFSKQEDLNLEKCQNQLSILQQDLEIKNENENEIYNEDKSQISYKKKFLLDEKLNTNGDSINSSLINEAKKEGVLLVKKLESSLILNENQENSNNKIKTIFKNNGKKPEISNKIFNNCEKNIKLSTKLEKIISQNHDKFNKKIKKNEVIKEKNNYDKVIIKLLKDNNTDDDKNKKSSKKINNNKSKKEILQEKYEKIKESEEHIKNGEIIYKLSDKMAIEYRKELIKKFKFNYKNDEDYIFDDSFLERQNNNKSNSRENLKKSYNSSKMDNHQKIENFINQTIKAKERLIKEINRSLSELKNNQIIKDSEKKSECSEKSIINETQYYKNEGKCLEKSYSKKKDKNYYLKGTPKKNRIDNIDSFEIKYKDLKITRFDEANRKTNHSRILPKIK